MANKTSTANAARKLAFARIAPAALTEGTSRATVIALLKQAGAKHIDKPDGTASTALKAAMTYQRSIRDEYIAGRLAARLFATHNGSDDEKIAKARAFMALPNAKSDKPNRRTEAQERAYGAARVAWSAILKDAGIISADKRGGDTSKTRKPRASKANASKQPPVAPQRVATPKVKTSDEVRTFLQQQGAMMLAFINKNAGVVPTDISDAVTAFRNAVNTKED